ncbi:HpcH/HpaI aldolase/citrate lyase family protein [Aeromicrobium sp.]
MTDATMRPRRSVLYMPGANERALEKAKTLEVDALILDLEDSVSPDSKADARDRVCAAARSREYGYRELVIRTNGIDTEWHADDLGAASQEGPDGILVPKVNSADDVRQIEAAMVAAGAPDHTLIWAMIETPVAIRQVHEIAAASDRLAVLVMGTNDLVAELHAAHVPGRAPVLTSLSLALLGAAEAGKAILDGVYNDVKNNVGFEAECEQGRDFGFDGKTIIHPSQIEPANRIFAPSPKAIEHANQVITAFEEAAAAGRGVVTVNGRMIENLHVRDAERILAFSESLANR